MSSSGFQSDDAGSQPEPQSVEIEQTATSGNADLMEQVLAETLAASGLAEITPVELARLRQVADRHAGESQISPPIVVELVQTVLEFRFPEAPTADAARWQTMTARIAGTLLEDPTSTKRLDRLWQQLNMREAK